MCEKCSHQCSCQECLAPEIKPSLSEKIVGTVIGIVFFPHLLLLQILAKKKYKKEMVKLMNDPAYRQKMVEQMLAQMFGGIDLKQAGICTCDEEEDEEFEQGEE